jgi:hypothetical protein
MIEDASPRIFQGNWGLFILTLRVAELFFVPWFNLCMVHAFEASSELGHKNARVI